MKKSIISAIAGCKCPRCREGKLFVEKNPYKLKTIAKMPEHCSSCGLALEREPGFYWGAMYISYALTVGFSAMNFLVVYLLWGWLTWQFVIENAILLILLFPVIFRYSRVLLLYMFVRFSAVKVSNTR